MVNSHLIIATVPGGFPWGKPTRLSWPHRRDHCEFPPAYFKISDRKIEEISKKCPKFKRELEEHRTSYGTIAGMTFANPWLRVEEVGNGLHSVKSVDFLEDNIICVDWKLFRIGRAGASMPVQKRRKRNFATSWVVKKRKSNPKIKSDEMRTIRREALSEEFVEGQEDFQFVIDWGTLTDEPEEEEDGIQMDGEEEEEEDGIRIVGEEEEEEDRIRIVGEEELEEEREEEEEDEEEEYNILTTKFYKDYFVKETVETGLYVEEHVEYPPGAPELEEVRRHPLFPEGGLPILPARERTARRMIVLDEIDLELDYPVDSDEEVVVDDFPLRHVGDLSSTGPLQSCYDDPVEVLEALLINNKRLQDVLGIPGKPAQIDTEEFETADIPALQALNVELVELLWKSNKATEFHR